VLDAVVVVLVLNGGVLLFGVWMKVYRRSGQRRALWYTRAISIVVPRIR
jgi:hypothetical protein